MSHYGNERPSSTKKKGGPAAQREFVFVNHELSVEERADLRSMTAEVEFPLDLMLGLVADGMQVKLAADKTKGGGYRCHILDDGQHDASKLLCLSGRGSTPEKAWHAVAYRHFHLAQGDWSYFALGGNRDEDYG